MTKPINVKVVCACGEEVTEKRKEIISKLMSALQCGYYDIAGPLLLSLFEEDLPAEPDPNCPCCKLNHRSPYSCIHCDPHNKKLDKRRSSSVC